MRCHSSTHSIAALNSSHDSIDETIDEEMCKVVIYEYAVLDTNMIQTCMRTDLYFILSFVGEGREVSTASRT